MYPFKFLYSNFLGKGQVDGNFVDGKQSSSWKMKMAELSVRSANVFLLGFKIGSTDVNLLGYTIISLDLLILGLG